MTSGPATRRPGGADPAMGLARKESQPTPRANLSSLRAAQRPRVRRSPVGFDLRSLVDLLLAENFTHPAAQPNSQTARSRSGHRENPRDDDDDEGEDFVYDNSVMDELESWWSGRPDRALTPRRSSPRRRRRLQPPLPRVGPAPSRTRGCRRAASPAAARRRPCRLRPTTESPRCR